VCRKCLRKSNLLPTSIPDSSAETFNNVNQIKPPPSIFVKGIIEFSKICEVLIELIGVDNFYCESSYDRLKIQTATPESYRSLVHFLKKKDAQYHTYQLKEDEPTGIVIRNIHSFTSLELIKSELELHIFIFYFTKPPNSRYHFYLLTWNLLNSRTIYSISPEFFIPKLRSKNPINQR